MNTNKHRLISKRSAKCVARNVHRRFCNVTNNPRSELTNAAMGTKSFSFDFDNLGNRETYTTNGTTFTYTANNLNQYTQITNGELKTFTYDLDGNTLTYNDWTYSWNGESRLSQATNSSTVVSFKYDFQGRRFQKVVGGITNSFVYDGWNLVQETSGTNVTRYVWGTDLSGGMQGAGGIGGLLCVIENGVKYFPCFDANGNITEYVDINGTVVAHYEYSAFGKIITSSGSKKDDFHFRFSTKYYDTETGFYYYGYRYYDPETGRLLSRDPLTERESLNFYLFAFNDPVRYFDPDGRAATTVNNSGGNSGGNGSQQFNYCQCLKVEHSRLYYANYFGSFWGRTYFYESVLPPSTKPKWKSWCKEARWVQIKVVPKYGGENALVGNNSTQVQTGQNTGNQDPVATECRNLIRRRLRTNFGWRNDYRYYPIVDFTTPAGSSSEYLWSPRANMRGNWLYQTRASKNVLWAPGNITVKIRCVSPSGTANCNLSPGTGTLTIN